MPACTVVHSKITAYKMRKKISIGASSSVLNANYILQLDPFVSIPSPFASTPDLTI